jgi:hypothetical protein
MLPLRSFFLFSSIMDGLAITKQSPAQRKIITGY